MIISKAVHIIEVQMRNNNRNRKIILVPLHSEILNHTAILILISLVSIKK